MLRISIRIEFLVHRLSSGFRNKPSKKTYPRFSRKRKSCCVGGLGEWRKHFCTPGGHQVLTSNLYP